MLPNTKPNTYLCVIKCYEIIFTTFLDLIVWCLSVNYIDDTTGMHYQKEEHP